MKVSELKDEKLDYWVARANGKIHDKEVVIAAGMTQILHHIDKDGNELFERYSPSTNWMKGGPIIEREEIVWTWVNTFDEELKPQRMAVPCGNWELKHKSPLVAAMRMFVAIKFGAEVDDR